MGRPDRSQACYAARSGPVVGILRSSSLTALPSALRLESSKGRQPTRDDRVRPLSLLQQPLPEVPRMVRVDRQRPSVAPHVLDDRTVVLRPVVALDEPGHHQPARRIVVNRDQRHLARPASSQS